MSDSKPCKCGCGGEVWTFMTLYPENRERPYICQCRQCFTRTGGFPTEKEATEAWNIAMGSTEKFSTVERTAKAIQIKRANTMLFLWKCENCGQSFHRDSWGKPVNFCSQCGCRLEWDE